MQGLVKRVIVLVWAACGLVAGCGPYSGIQHTFVDMHPTCPVERTTRSTPFEHVTRVEGCGEVEDWHLELDPSIPIDWVLASDVRGRAAIEMECDASALAVTTVAHRQIGVVGCGQRAIYLLVDGLWVANSISSR
ncbi:MAG: hypothetical protein H6726_30680 [Sandaracinaceae bacterium]|nr:hypothetical protein [Sandaracinaceae bacterium]